MKTISFVNMKGGVAKTTLAVNVAHCLAHQYGHRTLIVDLDPQFNATQCLISGQKYVDELTDGKHTVLNIFDQNPRPLVGTTTASTTIAAPKLKDIQPWEIRKQLDLLPGNLDLYRLDMGGGQGREHRVERFLEQKHITETYDFVIIDTPPTPSAWMTSALVASDFYVVPVKPEPLFRNGH